MQRRDYLKLAGSAVAGSGLATGAASADQQVLDVVDDLGADNTGNSPIDDDVQPAIDDDTVLEFPDGTYLVGNLVTYDVENFHMVGTGDATLVPTGSTDGDRVWIGGSFVRDLTFEGFTLDTGGTGVDVGFGAYDGLTVRDITKVGTHTSNEAPFRFAVWESDGHGLVENVRATDGDVFDDTVGAAGIYTDSAGTMTFENCELAGWGDNGLYASNADGAIMVKGGRYENNNISQVRLSSPGSTIRGATIRVDAPRAGISNMRGIWVQDGPGPVDVEDCDVEMLQGEGAGGVVTGSTGGTTNVRNSRIFVNEEYTIVGTEGEITSYGVLAQSPYGVDPYIGVTVTGTSITGGGNDGSAILTRRGNTVVTDSCIDQSGSGRNGVYYQTDYGGSSVTDSTVDVPGRVVYFRQDDDVDVDNIDTSGSCPLPDTGSTSDTGSSDLALADLPMPTGVMHYDRPVTGETGSNPTAVIYGQYTEPAMESFMGANFPRIVDDFVREDRLNVEYRNVPVSPETRFLSEIGVGVWDLEPENYWGFVEHVLENQDSATVETVPEARSLLQDAGVRNAGWIPWRAKTGLYDDIVDADANTAADIGMTDWDDFPPILVFEGDVAAPQYSYEGGIKDWLDARL